MKLGIIGGGLTSLSLAKSLVNQGIKVDLFFTEPKSLFSGDPRLINNTPFIFLE